MKSIELLAEVALLHDLPQHHLRRGQVGTVVEIHSENDVEVEFVDDAGNTYALLPLPATELIRLHHRPIDQAA